MDPFIVVATITGLIVAGVSAYFGYRQYRLAKDQASSESILTGSSSKLTANPEESEIGEFDDTSYREWLKDLTGFIDIRGIAIGSSPGVAAIRYPILQLYTDLYVQRGPANWDLEDGIAEGNHDRIPLTDVLQSSRNVAIIGEPGSGKTTFLQYTARKHLEQPNEILPIFISLVDVYEYAQAKTGSGSQQFEGIGVDSGLHPDILIEFLAFQCKHEGIQVTSSDIEQRNLSGQCLWLLDGFDELPSRTAREVMVEVIALASRRWRLCQFVLTSRPLAMIGRATPLGFEVVSIDQLHNQEIHTFLRTWTSLLFAGSSEAAQLEYCNELYSTVVENPQLRSLARNPVMLTSMAVVHYNQKRLPEGRADLLEAVVHWLIHAKERVLQTSRNRLEFIEARHREIALAMFEYQGGRKIRIGRGRAASQIKQHFGESEGAALEFLDREENETGLLIRRGEGDVAFWHPWFQEYLAAKEIAGKRDEEAWAKIKDHLDDAEWREVLSLVPACLNRLGSDRVDLFFERLGNSCLDSDLSTKIRRVGLGGRIIRDLLVIGYKPTSVTSWEQVLSEITPIFDDPLSDIPLQDKHDAAVAFGLMGDTRLRQFDKTWALFPGGSYLMGSQSECLAAKNYDALATAWEAPVTEVRVNEFEIRKYPITIQEFDEFVRSGGYSRQELWGEEGWQWRCENGIEAPGNWEEQLSAPNCPITEVSWFEAVAYCNWLTDSQKTDSVTSKLTYRLPSEAEWEFVARRYIPHNHRFPWGNELSSGDNAEVNWTGSNLRTKAPIGLFPASNTPDGITDLYGNVEEWCADSWSENHVGYSDNGLPRTDAHERRKVVRGGSTIRAMRLCRPSYRSRIYQDRRYATVGFRPVRTESPE